MVTHKKTTGREEELTKQVAKLESKVSELEEKASQSMAHKIGSFLRQAFIVFCIFLCALSLNLGVAAIWVKRNVTNTDVWVDKTSQLMATESVRNDISAKITEEIFVKADVEDLVKETVPEKISVLAVPLTNNFKSFTSDKISEVLASDKFQTFWQEANRKAHAGIMESLDNGGNTPNPEDKVIFISNEQLLLNLKPVVKEVQAQLADTRLAFVSSVNTDNIDKTITLSEIESLPRALAVFDFINKSAKIIPLIGLITGALAIGLSRKKRKVIIAICISVAVLMVANVQVIYLSRYPTVGQVSSTLQSVSTESAQTAIDILINDLILLDRVLIGLSIIILLATVLTGPGKYATAFKLWLARLTSGNNDNKLVKAIAENAVAIVTVLATITALLVVFPPVKGPTFPIVVIGIVSLLSVWILSLKAANNENK